MSRRCHLLSEARPSHSTEYLITAIWYPAGLLSDGELKTQGDDFG